MSLITNTKINAVNNLSDARYCAGMGAQYIGFSMADAQVNQDFSKLGVIAGWVAGVNIVLEFEAFDALIFERAVQAIKPDLIQISGINISEQLQLLQIPIISLVDTDDLTNLTEQEIDQLQANFILTHLHYDSLPDNLKSKLKILCATKQVFLGGSINQSNVRPLLDAYQPYGIALQGGEEEKPGYKTFDQLAEVLEILEEEN
jgi:phosphoribosylanthranilate isomerase